MTSIRMRTCIATKKRYPDTRLLRLVLVHDEQVGARIVPDPHRRLPGRGAWIIPEISALELVERNRGFARAFRTSAHVDTGQVWEYLRACT